MTVQQDGEANSIIKLRSQEGEVFELDKPVAMQINFVKNMLEGKLQQTISA